MDFLHSVEFYVILLVAAAIVVALFAIPNGVGPVETDFVTGDLDFNPAQSRREPQLEITCMPDGTVRIIRTGLPEGTTSAATAALAITRKGFDLKIEERLTPDASAYLASEARPVNCAIYYLSGLAHERYHIKFNCESTSSFAAFTLNNIPNLNTSRPLLQA